MKSLYVIIAFCLLISYTTFSQTISSNAPLCGNANLTLELTATGGSTYAWKGPNSFTSTQQNPILKNVNYRNRGVYTVTIDNKTTLTTDVNIKDPVAFTVPKEISVYRASTLLIEPKNSKLTDSTEVPNSYSFITPRGNTMSGNIVPVVLEGEVGTYKVIGNSNSSGCSVTQNVKVSINDKTLGDKMIEIVSLSNIKICYGQDFAIPFYPRPQSYFKEGTKYKVYLVKSGELSPTSRQPDAIVDKSPAVLKGITDNSINYYNRVLIIADDAEQTKGISDYRRFPDPHYLNVYYQNNVTTSLKCDSAKLNVNYNDYINSIQWFQDGKAITGANNKDLLAKNSGTFTYKFKGNSEPYDIDKTCIYESKPVKIELGKIEKPSVSVSNSIELCVGKPATLNASSKANTNYRWKKDGNYISNAISTSYQTLQEGKYQVEAKEGTCTEVSDTVEIKNPDKLNNVNLFTTNSTFMDFSNSNNGIYKICPTQTYGFATNLLKIELPRTSKIRWFKDGFILKDSLASINNLKGEGNYFVKVSYGKCEGISNSITIQVSKTLKGVVFSSEILPNNLIEKCSNTNAANISLGATNGLNNKLGNGMIYQNDKVLQNWDVKSATSGSYYSSNISVTQSGKYYAIGKIVLPDNSECNIVTDTVTVNFAKKIQENPFTYIPEIKAVPISTCKDTVEIGSYYYTLRGREIAYKWTKDGVTLKQDSSGTLSVTQPGIYQLETSYKGACTVVTSPYKVELGKNKVNFKSFESILSPSASICDGSIYYLYPYAQENRVGNIYNLYKDGQQVNSTLPNIISLTQPGTYNLTVKNGKCEGTSPDFTLKVDKIPTSITPSDSVTFCAGKTVELKASTETGLSYIWERNGQVISQANQAALTASTDGLYKATLLRGSCWGITPSVKLKSLANIIPTATLTGDKKIDYDQGAKLSINLTSHAPWTFKLSDGKEYTATKSPFEVFVKPLSTTTYNLTEVKNICGTGTVTGTAKIEVIILSSEEESGVTINIYPMPTTEVCNWQIQMEQSTTVGLTLLNMNGQTQVEQSSPIRSQKHTGTIDLSTMKSGTYLLKINVGEKTITRKIVKF